MCGVACGPPPVRELAGLRRAVRDVVSHGVGRAAPELLFCLLSPQGASTPPPWRASALLRRPCKRSRAERST
eukprot:11224242-Lingulodinium_polyedra.AAC.1